MNLIIIAISFIIVNNFILSKFMGLCPFIGVSKNPESAIGMGAAVIFVMSIASVVTQLLYLYVLSKLNLEYLKTISFILVIAALVQLVELVIRKISPSLYKALGIYLPLITTNCAVLGISILAVDEGYNIIETFVAAFAGGVGFFLSLIIMSYIRVKLDLEKVPRPFKGVSIAFIIACAMALAFMAFDSSMISNLFGVK